MPKVGYKCTKEHRENMSRGMKGRTAWNKGIPSDPIANEKRRITQLKRYEQNPDSFKLNKPRIKRILINKETKKIPYTYQWYMERKKSLLK